MSNDSVAQDQLIAYVRRIEALEDEGKAINDDKSEVYKEARGNGFDTKIIRKVVAKRRLGSAERDEQDALFQLYWDAIHGVVRAHVENIEEFGSRAKAAHAVSRGDDVGELQHSSEPGNAEAVEPGRQTPASAGAGPAPIIEPEAAMLPQIMGAVEALVNQSTAARKGVLGNEGKDEASSARDALKSHSSPAGTQAPPVDTHSEPAAIPPTVAVEAARGGSVPSIAAAAPDTNVVPIRKQWKHSDKAHPDCLDPGMCGGLSNLARCQRCKEAANAGQVA